jgi:hypothetical protein
MVAAAAALVVAGGGAVTALGADEDPAGAPPGGSRPAVDPSAAPSGEPRVAILAVPNASGRCMVPTAEVLRRQSLAVLGRAAEVGERGVTLRVRRTYAGEEVDRVRVEAPREQLQLLLGAVAFGEGGQYLVAATDGRVAVCGLSGPATPARRSLYDEAFPG